MFDFVIAILFALLFIIIAEDYLENEIWDPLLFGFVFYSIFYFFIKNLPLINIFYVGIIAISLLIFKIISPKNLGEADIIIIPLFSLFLGSNIIFLLLWILGFSFFLYNKKVPLLSIAGCGYISIWLLIEINKLFLLQII